MFGSLYFLFHVVFVVRICTSVSSRSYSYHRRSSRRRGEGSPPNKLGKNYFSGEYHVKFGHCVIFFGQISCKIRAFAVIFSPANVIKFGHFVNFSCIYFLAKMSCPPSLPPFPQSWLNSYAYDSYHWSTSQRVFILSDSYAYWERVQSWKHVMVSGSPGHRSKVLKYLLCCDFLGLILLQSAVRVYSKLCRQLQANKRPAKSCCCARQIKWNCRMIKIKVWNN